MAKVSRTAPILSVTVAAELAGMHAQTVRQYDRMGLVVAQRTRGGGRRYSLNDVDKLAEIQRLSQEEGVSLAGIAKIFDLQDQLEKSERARTRLERENAKLRGAVDFLHEELTHYDRRINRVFAAGPSGDVLMADRFEDLRSALREQVARERGAAGHDVVVWRPRYLVPQNLF
ncbi:heat shock protein transcriptional repressor HspR [Trueperella pecoris]|uniref:MerR family transcriptional regulator n=1 Tax=Trueperella pecoris TaxID=2733571 RepID=A0A7M1QVH2_9ACTO|nr:MerR family transcriptional regulator [Trueperella pecoris]QOQ39513.1 MerR family transcriptional regulator [Trueperella pecoris]QOR45866.1 MerR family transcriptional regulator [Trueperella pecoris]QTG75694.1 MerR family transcriptional regulator [Trueperella pecoris]